MCENNPQERIWGPLSLATRCSSTVGESGNQELLPWGMPGTKDRWLGVTAVTLEHLLPERYHSDPWREEVFLPSERH